MEELLLTQNSLQQEAREVLKELQLLEYLSQFGRPETVGSVATGLMTWRDIDIELVKEIKEEEYWQTVKFLFHQSKFKRTLVMDFRNSTNPNIPKGLHICVKDYVYKDKTWKIDIWFLPPRHPEEDNFHTWLREHLKEEHRLPILTIKKQLAKNPQYKKVIFSVDIYKAVIEDGVRELVEFKRYLEKSGRKL